MGQSRVGRYPRRRRQFNSVVLQSIFCSTRRVNLEAKLYPVSHVDVVATSFLALQPKHRMPTTQPAAKDNESVGGGLRTECKEDEFGQMLCFSGVCL